MLKIKVMDVKCDIDLSNSKEQVFELSNPLDQLDKNTGVVEDRAVASVTVQPILNGWYNIYVLYQEIEVYSTEKILSHYKTKYEKEQQYWKNAKEEQLKGVDTEKQKEYINQLYADNFYSFEDYLNKLIKSDVNNKVLSLLNKALENNQSFFDNIAYQKCYMYISKNGIAEEVKMV
jgi:c-di-AMP phosphodiesterase-like protein